MEGSEHDIRAANATSTPDARLRPLIDVGRALVSELDLDEILRRVLEVARDLTGARYAAIGIIDAAHTGLERFLTSGIDAATVELIGPPPRGRGVLGELIRDPTPLILDDVSSHPRSHGFPAHHPPMTSFLGVPISVRGEAWGNLYLTEKPSGPFDESDEEALLVLADWAAIAIRNAGVYTAERRRRDALEKTVAALEATMSIARALGAETDLDRVLELVTERGRALVEARVMLIALNEGDELVVRSVAGNADEDLLGRPLTSEQRLAAGMLVPLSYRGQTVGMLVAVDRIDGDSGFVDDDRRLLEAFAASAATAVVIAQRVAASTLRRRVEAAELERARWARELHDDSLQDLAGLRILLSASRRTGREEDLSRAVDEAITRLSGSIDGLRGLIADLRPAALDQLGVAAALTGLADRTRAHTPLDVGMHVHVDETQLDPEVASTIYRLVQEGLSNVVKHAGAREANVSVVQADGMITVRIEDDGDGFEPETPTKGFGLLGMSERVELAGGHLRIESAPGGRTRIEAQIPASGGADLAAGD